MTLEYSHAHRYGAKHVTENLHAQNAMQWERERESERESRTLRRNENLLNVCNEMHFEAYPPDQKAPPAAQPLSHPATQLLTQIHDCNLY